MTSLFPENTAGFLEKGPNGALAQYCARCDHHLSAHAVQWCPGVGSIRQCPEGQRANHRVVAQPVVEDATASAARAPSAALVSASPPYGTDFNAILNEELGRPGKRASPQRNAESKFNPKLPHRPPRPSSMSGAGLVVLADEKPLRLSKGGFVAGTKQVSHLDGASLQVLPS
jgi:hypothetical protein